MASLDNLITFKIDSWSSNYMRRHETFYPNLIMKRCPFNVTFQDQFTARFYGSNKKIKGRSQTLLGNLIHVQGT